MKNWIEKITKGEIKIKDGSDRLIVWNNELWNQHRLLVDNHKRKECCQIRQVETEKYSPEMKRWWIYVNYPEEALMYVAEVGECETKFPENHDCPDKNCLKEAKEFNEKKSKSPSGKIHKFAYKMKLLYEFKNPLSLSKLKEYESIKGKKFRPQRNSGKRLVKVNTYPKLVKDIEAGKIF